MESPLISRTLAEAIGTFALVFVACGAIVVNDTSGGAITHLGVAVVFGLVIMAMIYAVGDVSGAHFNPAVTLAFVVAGRFPLREAPAYVAGQCVGAAVGAGLLAAVFAHPTYGATVVSEPATLGSAALLEAVMTGVLMFVILRVSTGAKEKGITAGAAIGATVAIMAAAFGPVTGASMNPARSLGPALAAGLWVDLWLYMVAPVVGAIAAVPLCHAVTRCDDACCGGLKLTDARKDAA